MCSLKIAVAQVPSKKGNIKANLATHLNAIEKANNQGVSYLVFPELSLTGYEPELASRLAFTTDDNRFLPLIESAKKHKIHIGIGAPIATDGLPQVGLFIITPDGSVETYAKMNVTPTESKFFSAGTKYHTMEIDGVIIANAICADTNNPSHIKAYADMNATVYIAGVITTDNGYKADSAMLSGYAHKLNMLIAIANHNQPTGAWTPIGKSSIWDSCGPIAVAGIKQSTLVIATKNKDGWSGQQVLI